MSLQHRINNKRIAKNTLMLYFRMFLTMGVSLFTSRVVLNVLGVEDYGTYNVVGGVVAMFSLFTGSMSTAISRFLTYEFGKGRTEKLTSVFSTSVNIQICMAIVITVLAEIGGMWFLDNHMNIPEGRMEAAHWVLHFSILTFAFNLISVSYNAAIIAHEHMSAFAYIGILEVVLKLVVVYLLYISPVDKLITYAFMLAAVAFVIRFIYGVYCSRNFEECHYRMVFDGRLLKQMTGFAGWNLLGTGAYLFNTQGVNIITNIFFGVTTNAARGVAGQVEGIIRQFVGSFTTALNPQITKSYAAGDMPYMYTLVCRGAKFSYFLMFIFAVPFMFETETIMYVWLKNYPPEAPLFLRLSMIGVLFDILGNSTANAVWATGRVRRYYIIVGAVGSLVFPISWLCFVLGGEAYVSYIVFMAVYFAVIFVKLYIVRGLINFPVRMFYRDVLLRIALVSVLAAVLPAVFYLCMDDMLSRCFAVCAVSLLSTSGLIYGIGLSQGERAMINGKIRTVLKRVR